MGSRDGESTSLEAGFIVLQIGPTSCLLCFLCPTEMWPLSFLFLLQGLPCYCGLSLWNTKLRQTLLVVGFGHSICISITEKQLSQELSTAKSNTFISQNHGIRNRKDLPSHLGLVPAKETLLPMVYMLQLYLGI